MKEWDRRIAHPITGQENPAYLHGVIVPMFTPCNSNGTLDERGIRSYLNYLVSNGSVNALFARSGLGRMYTFSVNDVRRLADIVIDEVADRLPVFVGCSGELSPDSPERPDAHTYLRQSIELCQYVQRKGATAAVLVLPVALVPHREELPAEVVLEYFRRVEAETDIPLIIYQPPETTRRFRATPSLIEEVSRSGQVVGMKISTSRMDVFLSCSKAAQNANFALIAGDETVFLFTILVGGTGVIGQGCTTHPEILKAVYERAMAFDLAGASKAALDTFAAVNAAPGETLDGVVFRYLQRQGVTVQPYSRDGGRPPSEEISARFASSLDAVRSGYRDSMVR
ncbi:MAG TPA: dihydrodipicolinate synthase family protein [Candidatus Latescibacteria bacterium]|nr:dihydrodipicolinate synthase family protein [Candidatus Latescibacterota bacterium]